ncbi:MAG TPA: NADH-quinone oxidoreductase subunit H [Mycobacteriales bacterium]|nr:NADH-quinone oxidoreductase subunit H [Mycobacteriales bacterium]
MTLTPPAAQALQVITVAGGSPLVSGVIGRVEARLQGRRGTRVLQPYYDLAKLFRKESLAPESASWVFLATPFIAFVAYLSVPLLIPVLTNYPLPLGYMGDILGGGLILALGGFFTATAAAETSSPYAQIGASRVKTFGALAEPTLLLVFVAVATITSTDLPYALAGTIHHSTAQIVRPGHLLAAAALLCVILFETGRIPIEGHHGTNEFGFIDEGKPFEHSGPYYALLKWGSHIKQMVLYTIFLDVFLVPWGLAGTGSPGHVVLAIPVILGKCAGLGVVVAVIDDNWAKLRLYKITEFLAAAFLLAVLAIFTLIVGGG